MDSSGCSVCELQFSRKGAVVRHCFAHFRLSVLALFLRIKCESCAGGYEVFFIAIYYNNIPSYITVKKKKKSIGILHEALVTSLQSIQRKNASKCQNRTKNINCVFLQNMRLNSEFCSHIGLSPLKYDLLYWIRSKA